MKYHYVPKGVCATSIDIEIQDGIIGEVWFSGGCAGNSKGISALVQGMKVDDVLDRLSGICCGYRSTSCPDQLCHGLRAIDKEISD